MSLYPVEPNSSNNNGSVDFTYSGNIQYFTAGHTGKYQFLVDGAQGGVGDGNASAGAGAEVRGDIVLQAGARLEIIVGGAGGNGSIFAGGGGGGSFVFAYDAKNQAFDIPEFVAGGGGGGGGLGYSMGVGGDGQTEGTGGNGGTSGIAGGSGGQNGLGGQGGSYDGGGGGGYTGGDGGFASTPGNGQGAAQNGGAVVHTFSGGAGRYGLGNGGFGGGGGGGEVGGGGGGGYGGGGGGSGTTGGSGGGGGGSYIDRLATNKSRTESTHTGNGHVLIAAVCFCTGTLIRTARGDVAVEDLVVGDLAVTISGDHRPIRWIGHREINCSTQDMPTEVWPIRILVGAFGPNLPARTLYLSPGHPVLVGADEDGDGGYLVPVMCLINGTTIEREPREAVTYWHVELDRHDILLAEGLPAESYLDWGDRAFFTEGADHALANPDFVVPGLDNRCRPVAVDGLVVEGERRRLDGVFAASLTACCAWPGSSEISLGF